MNVSAYVQHRRQWDQVWSLAADPVAAIHQAATFASPEDLARLEQALANLNRRPVVGEPATYHIGSDRYAARVVWVSPSGHQCRVAIGGGEPGDGTLCTRRQCRVQMPVWAASTSAPGIRYVMAGGNYGTVTFGHAEDYRDPSF